MSDISRINLKIYPIESKVKEVGKPIIVTGITNGIDGTNYYEIKEYAKLYGQSVTTVRRRLNWVKDKNWNKYCLNIGGKYFVSPLLNTIDKPRPTLREAIQVNYHEYLSQFDWTFFCCVAFENGLSIPTVRRRMESYYNRLLNRFKDMGLKMFYVTEKNPGRKGYHSHFILKIDDDNQINGVINFSRKHFGVKGEKKYADFNIERYNPNLNGIEYLVKEINRVPDGYDLFVESGV